MIAAEWECWVPRRELHFLCRAAHTGSSALSMLLSSDRKSIFPDLTNEDENIFLGWWRTFLLLLFFYYQHLHFLLREWKHLQVSISESAVPTEFNQRAFTSSIAAVIDFTSFSMVWRSCCLLITSWNIACVAAPCCIVVNSTIYLFFFFTLCTNNSFSASSDATNSLLWVWIAVCRYQKR